MSTAAQVLEREQKIQQLIAGGRDRWSAENLVDGRPEWSQRITNVSPEYTKDLGYLANQKAHEGIPSLGTPTLSDLETQLLDIDEQLDYWRNIRETAEQA